MWSRSQQDSGAQRNTEKQAFESTSKFPDASLHIGELTLFWDSHRGLHGFFKIGELDS